MVIRPHVSTRTAHWRRAIDKDGSTSKYLTYMLDRSKQLQEILDGFHTMRRQADLKGYCTLNGLAVTNAQWRTLDLIHRAEVASVKDIRLAFGISSSAATQLVGELVRKHYAIKEMSDADKRTTIIRLTPKTRRAMARLQRAVRVHMVRLFSALTDKEFAEYARLNRKILTSFRYAIP